jgi:hypothetical protein
MYISKNYPKSKLNTFISHDKHANLFMANKPILIIWVFILLFQIKVKAQHTYIPLGQMSMQVLDRLEIKSGELNQNYFHSSNKSYRRKSIAEYIETLNDSNLQLSNQDRFNINYVKIDNFEWTNAPNTQSKRKFGKTFYQEKAAIFSVVNPEYSIVLNPVLGYDVSSERNQENFASLNNRGIELRGHIGKNIGFYSQVSDEILIPNSYTRQRFYYDSNFMYINFYKPEGDGSISYFNSSGYITANLNKYMELQFGHTRNFIGDGYRTFILGNNQPEYLNLKLSTRFWKLNYTNIWAELRDYPVGRATQWLRFSQPKHYMATHHLSINLSKNFNLGIFETILFQRDSGHSTTGFDLNYLNPIIFYKSVEDGLNSLDKSIIGMNFKWNIKKKFSLYGQFVFAEFVFNDLKAGNGSYTNKFALQGGLKYIDVLGISNLDLQGEVNISRPYMYTSYLPQNSFSNFRQSMAHPLGANFKELVGIIRYQPMNRIFMMAKAIIYMQGLDTNGSNWGSNIRKSYYENTNMYGNYIGQGVKVNTYLAELTTTWMPKHNLFIDAKYTYRKASSLVDWFNEKTNYFSFAIRYNFGVRNYDY